MVVLPMARESYDKLGLLMALLSKSKYRPWFWQHYKRPADQLRFRCEWQDVALRYSGPEIKDGFERWVCERGVDDPPTPVAFYAWLAPVKTDAAKAFLKQARKELKVNV